MVFKTSLIFLMCFMTSLSLAGHHHPNSVSNIKPTEFLQLSPLNEETENTLILVEQTYDSYQSDESILVPMSEESVSTPEESVVAPTDPVLTPTDPVLTPIDPVLTPTDPVGGTTDPVETPTDSGKKDKKDKKDKKNNGVVAIQCSCEECTECEECTQCEDCEIDADQRFIAVPGETHCHCCV